MATPSSPPASSTAGTYAGRNLPTQLNPSSPDQLLPARVLFLSGPDKPAPEVDTFSDLFKAAFEKRGARAQMFVAACSNDFIKFIEASNSEKKVFNLILIDLDTRKEESDMSVVNVAKLLRLLNVAAPILGFSSDDEDEIKNIQVSKYGDFSQSAFNSIFPKPLTAEKADSIVQYYCTNAKSMNSEAVEMYDSSNGAGLRSILATVVKTTSQSVVGSGETSVGTTPDPVGGLSPVVTTTSAINTSTSKGIEPAGVKGQASQETTVPSSVKEGEPLSAQVEAPLHDKKILIVEDSPSTMKLYKKIYSFALSRFNLQVQIDVASDGDEAVGLVQAGNKYLLITMDMEMQRVGGIDAAKLLRMLKVPSRIVACSGHSIDELMNDPFRGDIILSTIDKFVQKPLTRDIVMELVTQFVLPHFIHIPIHGAVSAISTYFPKIKADEEGADDNDATSTPATGTPTPTSEEEGAVTVEGDRVGSPPYNLQSNSYKEASNIPECVIRGLISYISMVRGQQQAV
mmetsp:Transcript_8234/g.14987  ORF Transcript_8234/g.14987 Transcript_8234/m.14987 type:complete len:514 (-) Transcript_8234:26-1567(-)